MNALDTIAESGADVVAHRLLNQTAVEAATEWAARELTLQDNLTWSKLEPGAKERYRRAARIIAGAFVGYLREVNTNGRLDDFERSLARAARTGLRVVGGGR